MILHEVIDFPFTIEISTHDKFEFFEPEEVHVLYEGFYLFTSIMLPTSFL